MLSLGRAARELPRRARARASAISWRDTAGTLLEDEPHQTRALFGLGEPDARDTETAVALRARGAAQHGDRGVRASRPASRPEQGPSAGIHAGRILIGKDGTPQRDERLSALHRGRAEMAALRERACGITLSAARNMRGLFVFEAATEGTAKKSEERAGAPRVRLQGARRRTRAILRPQGAASSGSASILSLATRRRVHVVTLAASGHRQHPLSLWRSNAG